MVDRTIIAPAEQMRDFDYVSGNHDFLIGLGALAADVLSLLPYTVVSGLIAAQTATPSLTINMGAGRIYQYAAADAVAGGSIPQDLTSICQQGIAPAQTITLIPPSAGQSQWSLIQAQFSQVDAVRTGDPTGGLVPFYNASIPTSPSYSSINTVRQGKCILQVISGSAATTGSEIPPTPTNGWVPLYLIDLVGGQTAITTAQIIKAGPSVGTGVPNTYPYAPFLAGFLASHHSGNAGQAPKVNLANEVQGILPYSNMSAVRQLLAAPLTVYVNNSTGSDSNNGLTAGTAFKTIQAAVNALYHNYDHNGNIPTISVANGTYTGSPGANNSLITITGLPLGAASLNLTGNAGSPGSVTLSSTTGNTITMQNGANVVFSGFTITSSGAPGTSTLYTGGYGLIVASAVCTIGNVVFGACANVGLIATSGATVSANGNPLTFTGGGTYAAISQAGALLWLHGSTITYSGTPAYSGANIGASSCGNVDVSSCTFVGSASGSRYFVNLNGTLYTANAGATFIPGGTAGTTANGGQYA